MYLEFSKHWSFSPNPCAPYKPEHKGKVERDVGYTKENALKGRKFDSLEEGNNFLKKWNKTWARTRIHGTHRTQVWKLFLESEKSILRPLVQTPFSFFKIGHRKVDVHGHVGVGRNFYSVPPQLIGQKLRVHFNATFVKIYDKENNLLTSHTPISGKGKCSTLGEHIPKYKPQNLEQAEFLLCKRAGYVGQNCKALIEKILLKPDNPLSIRTARGILSLYKKYSVTIIEQSCREALLAFHHSYSFVATMCEKISKNNITTQKLTQEHELIRDCGEYENFINQRSN